MSGAVNTRDGAEFSPRDLRDALSTFATGVCIITTRDAANRPVGVTASSFNSVSMDPPLVLWSITRTSLSAESFVNASHFAVNVLAADQVEISNRFARSGEDKFAGLDCAEGLGGAPLVPGAVTRFQCSNHAVHDGGDHHILIGKVEKMDTKPATGLVFYRGNYATAESLRSFSDTNATGNGAVIRADDPADIENLLHYLVARTSNQLNRQFHQGVHESGLSTQEWRLLASLSGEATRTLGALSRRTFIDSHVIADMLMKMEEQGLARTSAGADGETMASGTRKGHERVASLISLGTRQAKAALKGGGDNASDELRRLLKVVIANTDED